MAKIDLLDQKWIDLVFEGKNEAYGAYKIRQDTTKRNNLAMLFLLLGIAAIVGIFFAWGGIANAIAASEERNEGTEALEMVLDGRITDSKTMIIIMKAALMKNSGK